MLQPDGIIRLLADHRVEWVLVGGYAGSLYGASRIITTSKEYARRRKDAEAPAGAAQAPSRAGRRHRATSRPPAVTTAPEAGLRLVAGA